MESTAPENPTPPTEPTPPAPRRMLRSRSDRLVGGVCGGIARHFNLDPTLVRIGFVAGVVIWGATAVVYVAALLLMPEEPEDATAPAAAPLPARNRALTAIGIVLLVAIGGPIALGVGALLVPFAVLALAALFVAWLVTGRRPQGGGRDLARHTLVGVGLLVLLFALSVGSFWAAAAGGDEVIAAGVVLAGLALVASAFSRPARWLILPALAVAIPTAFVATAGVDLDGGVGEKRYRPSAAADVRDRYELGAGSLTLDLRNVELPAGDRRVHLDVGMGEAVVVVPEDVCVSTTAELGMGGVAVFDRESGGVDVDIEDANSAPAGTPRLVIDADVGLGAVEVVHDEADGHRRGSRDWDRGDWDDDARTGNLACEAA